MFRSSPFLRLLVSRPSFAGLLAANFALGMAYSFVMPFMSMWGTLDVKMSPLFFSVFMTTTAVSSIVVTTVLARWSDTHIARKTMLLLGGAGGVLGYLGYSYVRDPLVLLLIGSSVLALASVNFSQLFAYVREAYDGANASGVNGAVLMSIVRVCFSLAWTVGPAIGAWMMGVASYRGVFLGAAALYFLFFIGIVFCVPHEARPAGAKAAARQPVWRILTRRDILASFIAFALVFAAHAINMMNLPLTVMQVLGGSERDLGIIFGVGPLVEIPLMLWFGKIAAKGHQMRLIRIGAAATLLYFVNLCFVTAPWHIYLAQVLSGISFAIITNVAILFYQDLLPGQAGLATTIFSNSLNVGNLLGFFAFGPVVESFTNRGAFAVCAALSAITLVIFLCYRHQTMVTLGEGMPTK